MYNCSFCGAEVNDDALICPRCKERVAEENQRNKIEFFESKARDSVRKGFNSGSVVVSIVFLAILITVLAIKFIIQIGSMFGGGDEIIQFIGFAFYFLMLVGAIKTFSSSIKLHASKDKLVKKAISDFPLFNGFTLLALWLCLVYLVLTVGSVIFISAIATFFNPEIINSEFAKLVFDVSPPIFSNLLSFGDSEFFLILSLISAVVAILIVCVIGFGKVGGYYTCIESLVCTPSAYIKFEESQISFRLSIFSGIIFIAAGVIILSIPLFALMYFAFALYLIVTGVTLLVSISVAKRIDLELEPAAKECEKAKQELAIITKETDKMLAIENRIATEQQIKYQFLQQQMLQEMLNQTKNDGMIQTVSELSEETSSECKGDQNNV